MFIYEYQALNVISKRPELEGDATARREVAARIAALEDAIAERFARAFSRSLWRSGELVRRIDSSGDLSAFASLIAAQRFPAAPLIRNELINRDGLSSNLVAARRELMTAMLSHESEENLGFTYAVLDRYIRTGEIDDPEVKAKIDRLHSLNQFKLRYMDCFAYDPQ